MKSNEAQVLGYCTNIYQGTSWTAIRENLRTGGIRLTPLLPLGERLPIGLWLPAPAAREIVEEGRIQELQQICSDAQMDICSFNGFPYGSFHNGPIKEKVFYPDWSSEERFHYTRNLLQIGSQLARSGMEAEPGKDFGISTVPIAWKGGDPFETKLEAIVRNLSLICKEAYLLEIEKGVKLHVDLEPEPRGFLEASEEVVTFFKEYLLREAASILAKEFHWKKEKAEALVLEKLQICYDTCHAAVQFEEPQEILARYRSLGIRVGKVQVSSALGIYLRNGQCSNGMAAREALSRFEDTTYLHQVVGLQQTGEKVFFEDLPQALDTWEKERSSGEYRIHFHVPVMESDYGPLGTTQDHIFKLIEESKKNPICSYWEVETYTWAILRERSEKSCMTLEECMVKERDWVLSHLNNSSGAMPMRRSLSNPIQEREQSL